MIEEGEAETVPLGSLDGEIKELMGLFDLPAFARRGQDLDLALRRLHGRCRAQRETLLEMVHLRMRQWSRVATGPDDWRGVFAGPLDPLRDALGSGPARWAAVAGSRRQRRAVGLDLVASARRFNERWRKFLESLNLEPINATVRQYNSYYLLEKECVLGSARLASRHFVPVPIVSVSSLLEDHPPLPVPEPIDPG